MEAAGIASQKRLKRRMEREFRAELLEKQTLINAQLVHLFSQFCRLLGYPLDLGASSSRTALPKRSPEKKGRFWRKEESLSYSASLTER